jgi:hypothetical protein
VATAPELIRQWASEAGSPAYMALQSFIGTPEVQTYADGLPALETVFAGRIFGPDAEIRWLRDGGFLRVWRLSETGDPHDLTAACERSERNYYLHGIWDGAAFSDPRLPRSLQYPLDRTPDLHDRAFITAAEYRPALPEALPDTPEAWETLLNQPETVASRLLSLDCGQE